MKVIFMHGKNVGPNDKWYPWFGEQVRKLGFEYFAPTLPKSDNPYIEEWKQCISDLHPNEDTVLIGHSRGCVAILRWLEDQPLNVKVKKVILVAPNSGFADKMAIKDETNHGFYTEKGYDFAKIRKHCDDFVILHSKDDHVVPYEAGIENAEGLDARLMTFKNKDHFGEGVNEMSELLKELT